MKRHRKHPGGRHTTAHTQQTVAPRFLAFRLTVLVICGLVIGWLLFGLTHSTHAESPPVGHVSPDGPALACLVHGVVVEVKSLDGCDR